MASQKHGLPSEELFLNKPAPSDPETPTVGPLRINKAMNSSPPPRMPSAGSSSYNQGTSQSPYPAPTSKPPTAPLPYPDARPAGASAQAANPPYPSFDGPPKSTSPSSEAGAGRRRGSSATVPQPTSLPRTKFDANDPNRPTVSGYAHTPIYKDAGRNASPTTAPSAAGGSSLSERRANVPKPISNPASPDNVEQEGLFQRAPQRPTGQPQSQPEPSQTQAAGTGQRKPSEAALNPFPEYHQQYWPPPSGAASAPSKPAGLSIPSSGGTGLNRLDSTASVATTRAQRGSPPPPETPIIEPPGGGIEARFAASGIGSPPAIAPASSAAAQRAAQYPTPRPAASATPPASQQQQPPRRPWTPTEQPGSNPHGPPAVYQGMNEVPTTSSAPRQGQTQASVGANPGTAAARPHEQALEQDLSRVNINDEPPPAYSTVHQNGSSSSQGYPTEKARPAANVASPIPGPASAAAAAIATNQGHPAFANDPRLQPGTTPSPAQGGAVQPHAGASPAPAAGPASPPPLPEGWIAHLDPNSGQYYYIHLPSQSTQWEFPKGPTPLNLNEPLSPTGTFVNPLASPVGSTFSKLPLASPGFGGPTPQAAAFRQDTYLSMSSMSSPTAAGFTGPPPSAGVDVYKVAPTNGVYFGPYLRYTNMDIERGMWLGSVLLVTDAPQPPTIHLHQSVDLSPNREFDPLFAEGCKC
jgi:hypothetical protein